MFDCNLPHFDIIVVAYYVAPVNVCTATKLLPVKRWFNLGIERQQTSSNFKLHNHKGSSVSLGMSILRIDLTKFYTEVKIEVR